jgi:hypothetical protein
MWWYFSLRRILVCFLYGFHWFIRQKSFNSLKSPNKSGLDRFMDYLGMLVVYSVQSTVSHTGLKPRRRLHPPDWS